MLNNNKHHSSCAYAEQIVSYLYEEASSAEKIDFETHLETCARCADELSGFDFVRSSISQWRIEEISALEMPALEIPLWQSTGVVKTENVRVSWLENLKRVFSLSPKLAFGSAALAAVIACAGLVFIALNFSAKDNIAAVDDQKPGRILASNTNQTSEVVNILPLKENEQKPAAAPQTAEKVDIKTLETSNSARKNQIVKAVNNVPKTKAMALKSDNMAANSGDGRKNKIKQTKTQEIPKLSDFDEDEDKSLRLADLFGEIDTK